MVHPQRARKDLLLHDEGLQSLIVSLEDLPQPDNQTKAKLEWEKVRAGWFQPDTVQIVPAINEETRNFIGVTIKRKVESAFKSEAVLDLFLTATSQNLHLSLQDFCLCEIPYSFMRYRIKDYRLEEKMTRRFPRMGRLYKRLHKRAVPTQPRPKFDAFSRWSAFTSRILRGIFMELESPEPISMDAGVVWDIPPELPNPFPALLTISQAGGYITPAGFRWLKFGDIGSAMMKSFSE